MARTPWWDIPHEVWHNAMMIPYPYDWVAGWEEKHSIELPEEARAELIEWLIKQNQIEQEARNQKVSLSHR